MVIGLFVYLALCLASFLFLLSPVLLCISCIHTHVIFAAFFRQLNLSLPFAKSLSIFIGFFVNAVWAADPFYIRITLHIGFIDWHSAGMALIVLTGFQVVVNGNSLVTIDRGRGTIERAPRSAGSLIE